jgi:hypothetical protein
VRGTALLNWFDGLERILKEQSSLSGLLAHGSTVGQAREFVVTRILKTILPESIHIGSGLVIDSLDNYSKQIDIVLYDPRFPMMRVEGGGLYFVEGVLATVEVKSDVNSRDLKGALENSKSVLELTPACDDPKQVKHRIEFYMEKYRIQEYKTAEQLFNYRIRPATYLFSFNSQLSFKKTVDCVRSWWESVGYRQSKHFPLLPRVITAGEVVGIVNDGRFDFEASDNGNYALAMFKTQLRFRWFALHLMDTVNSRLGLGNFAEHTDYRISDYYPFAEYVSSVQGNKILCISLPHGGC